MAAKNNGRFDDEDQDEFDRRDEEDEEEEGEDEDGVVPDAKKLGKKGMSIEGDDEIAEGEVHPGLDIESAFTPASDDAVGDYTSDDEEEGLDVDEEYDDKDDF